MRSPFYILIALLFVSCDNEAVGGGSNENNSNPVINASTFSDISAVVEDLKSEPQTFDLNDVTTSSSVTGLGGTKINFDANSFTDSDGNPVTSGVVIHLEEYLTLAEMMKNNIQTTSNGQLLVTGGSFNLAANDINDNPLNVNPWSVSAELPIFTDISGFENQMSLFVGEVNTTDGTEQVNWVQAQNNESWISEEGFMNFYGLNLGLSNCDVLYNMAGEDGTQFSVYVENSTNPSNFMVWMFINDFPSVVNINQVTDDGQGVQTYVGSIPVGLNATLVVIGVDDDDYLKFGSLDISVEEDDVYTLTMEYGTSEALSLLIDQLGG